MSYSNPITKVKYSGDEIYSSFLCRSLLEFSPLVSTTRKKRPNAHRLLSDSEEEKDTDEVTPVRSLGRRVVEDSGSDEESEMEDGAAEEEDEAAEEGLETETEDEEDETAEREGETDEEEKVDFVDKSDEDAAEQEDEDSHREKGFSDASEDSPSVDKSKDSRNSSAEGRSDKDEEIIDLVDDDGEEAPTSVTSEEPLVFSEQQIRDLQDEIRLKERAIVSNKRMLNGRLPLPDNGAKLKTFVEKLEREKRQAEATLQLAVKSKAQPTIPNQRKMNTPTEDAPALNTYGIEDTVITDEQKLGMLRKKQRTLLQQASIVRPGMLSDSGAELQRQINKVGKEIIELEEKMNNRAASTTGAGSSTNGNRLHYLTSDTHCNMHPPCFSTLAQLGVAKVQRPNWRKNVVFLG